MNERKPDGEEVLLEGVQRTLLMLKDVLPLLRRMTERTKPGEGDSK